MADGQVVVVSVSSSDAEEEGGGGGSGRRAPVRRGRSSKRPASRAAPASRKRRRTLRKGEGQSTTEDSSTGQANFDLLSEDFRECLNGFHPIHDTKELWVDKYKPSSVVELAVHKKKVEEVKLWLEERVRASKEDFQNYTLLVTGQAGVGKSAAIRVIVSQLGAELCEWRTPTPTLWKEHMHSSNSGTSLGTLKQKFMRLPLKMDAPENVLCQAHAQARPIVDFLHENVLDFLSDEAIDDAWIVASYLSDADYLLATSVSPRWSQMIKGSYGPEVISQSVAASVSVRGVLFGNSQPLPSRWHSIRRPKFWQIEQSSRRNKNLMLSERFGACTFFTLRSTSDIATEYKPMMEWLGSVTSEHLHLQEKLSQCCRVESDDISLKNFGDDPSMEENEEDDIQEW